MTIPKFRIFIKKEKRLILSEDIYQLLFDFNGDNICVTFEDGTDEFYEANEVVLMQSTGLFDKNGKEIFEGDVVKTTRFLYSPYEEELIGVVKQLEGNFAIDTGNIVVYLWTEIEENEVTGNIFKNPELIKEATDG